MSIVGKGNEQQQQSSSLGKYLLDAIESHPPKNNAIIDENAGVRLTYEELAHRTMSVAGRIRACVQSGDHNGTGAVLLLLERTYEVPICQIASAIVGRSWIRCDVGQPRERIMRILDEAKPSCIIAEPSTAARLEIPSDFPAPIFYAEEAWNDSGNSTVYKEARPAGEESNYEPAYIVYTSGTTGTPKGVAIEQHSFIAFLGHIRSWVTRPGAPACLSSLLTSNPAFDGSLSQIYSALTTGGKLVVAKRGGEQDGEYIAALMHENSVNCLCTTTTAIRLWVMQAVQSHPGPQFFGPQFRYLLLGGDELPPRFVADIFARAQCTVQMQIKNVYGPTEGTIFSFYGTYRQSDVAWLHGRRRSPIDTSLPSAAMSIVGPDLRDLPLGAVGEIIIWGSCLAKEYVGLPALNAERFVNRSGIRGWKTGDLGRYTPAANPSSSSGAFEVLGRVDSMRKVLGGFRVDLEEVRLAVLSHERIRARHISTINLQDNGGAKENKIVAHVVLQPSSSTTVIPSPGALEEKDLEIVASWRTMFTGVNQSLEEYHEDHIDLAFDYCGWASSFDRSTISKEHMKEWVDCTIERILAQDCFQHPNDDDKKKPRVAEIGCGTGMLLLRLANQVASYYGTDLASSTVAQVQQHAQSLGYDYVSTAALPAHDFDSALDEYERFDLIICNSVAQYFPCLAYLDEVLHRARHRLAPGGVLFMGDICHGGLAKHHAAISAFVRSAKSHRQTVDELQQVATEILAKDHELQIEPSYFVDKCGESDCVSQGEARLELRRGLAPTEMTLFRCVAIPLEVNFGKPYINVAFSCRYDAVLMADPVKQDTALPPQVRIIQWGHQEDNQVPSTCDRAQSGPFLRPEGDAGVVLFQGIFNKRLHTSEQLRRLIPSFSATKSGLSANCLELEADVVVAASLGQQEGWDPEVALAQIQAEGYQGLILPSQESPVMFDLVVAPPSLRKAAGHWVFTERLRVPVANTAVPPVCEPSAQAHLVVAFE